MTEHQDFLLKGALYYATRLDWPIFPVYEVIETGCACGRKDCPDPGKHPRTEHGFHDATTDEATIHAWWARWPDANIGIRTGMESGLVVIDIDVDKGGEDSWEEFTQGHNVPDTVEAITGSGGRHIYFQHPSDREIKSRQGILPGVDIRADGGYVVAPPSRHAGGRK